MINPTYRPGKTLNPGGQARPGSNPGPAERHLSFFMRAAR
jgi:hypothetical protein